MKYDLSHPSQRAEFQRRSAALLRRSEGVVDITLLSSRTLPQNKYLHVIIALFASEYGETLEYVKEKYFKYAANSALFLRYKDDPLLGRRTPYLRSTADLTREETSLAIERFRSWSSINAGIYLPSSEEHRILQLAQIQISHHNAYL